MNMNNTAMENVEIFLATLSLVGNVIAVIGNILVCLTIYKSSRQRNLHSTDPNCKLNI